MLTHETQLWSKLQQYSLDNPSEALTFSQRLARENNWSVTFTERIIAEYKKFLFLCATSSHPVTPSDQVDQAWHLHLVYTKSYWNDLCKNILGKEIHHNPTQGGKQERDKFVDYYEATLTLYQEKFRQTPPQDIWPPTHERFSDIDFVRANTRTHWLLPKVRITWNKIAVLLIIAGIACSWLFSAELILLVSLLGVIMLAIPPSQKGDKRSDNGSGCAPTGCSACGNDGHAHHDHSGCSGGDSGCSNGGCSGCGGGD